MPKMTDAEAFNWIVEQHAEIHYYEWLPGSAGKSKAPWWVHAESKDGIHLNPQSGKTLKEAIGSFAYVHRHHLRQKSEDTEE